MTYIPPGQAEQTFAKGAWRFGTCEFDELRFELRVQDKVVDLERKPSKSRINYCCEPVKSSAKKSCSTPSGRERPSSTHHLPPPSASLGRLWVKEKSSRPYPNPATASPVSYTHLRAHE